MQGVSINRKTVEALDHGHQHHQMAVDHHKQEHGHVSKKPRHSTDLGIAGWIEKGSKVQTHLQANDFPRKLDGSKHQPDRKANGQAYGNLLCNRAECFRTVQGNNGLIYQRRLRAQCDEKREPNLGAHGDSAQRKQRRHRKHSQNP